MKLQYSYTSLTDFLVFAPLTLIILIFPNWAVAQSQVKLEKLHVDSTTERGEDEVYYEIYIDGKKTFTSSEQTMNEDSEYDVENWEINKIFSFDKKFMAKIMEKDRRKDDLIGEYSIIAGEKSHHKILKFTKGSKYSLSVTYTNGKSVNNGTLISHRTAYVDKYGAYQCNTGIDPLVLRGYRASETNSACSIPKDYKLKMDKNKLKLEADVNIDGFVPDKNYERFHTACSFHDTCYASPWESKGENGQKACDDRFLTDMIEICNKQHNDGSPRWIACRTAGRVFYTFVKLMGEDGYNSGQIWAAKNCPNPQR